MKFEQQQQQILYLNNLKYFLVKRTTRPTIKVQPKKHPVFKFEM